MRLTGSSLRRQVLYHEARKSFDEGSKINHRTWRHLHPDEQVGEALSGDAFGRLCFTLADEDAIDEDCRRLDEALGGMR